MSGLDGQPDDWVSVPPSASQGVDDWVSGQRASKQGPPQFDASKPYRIEQTSGNPYGRFGQRQTKNVFDQFDTPNQTAAHGNPFDRFDTPLTDEQVFGPQARQGEGNPYDQFDNEPAQQSSDSGIWRNVGAGLGEGLIGVQTTAHEMLDPAYQVANLANAAGHLFGRKDDLIPQRYIPGSYEQTNEALRPAGLAPEDVNAPTTADRLARTFGTGLSAAIMPGGGESLLPTLGQFAGRAFAGGLSGLGSGAAREMVPDPYKPLAAFIGAVGTGIPSTAAAERMFGAPSAERLGRLNDTRQLASDFGDSGVPTHGAAAAISGSRALAGTQAALKNYFTSAQTIGDAARRTLNGFKSFADRVAGGYGSADSSEEAGRSLQSGAKSFIQNFNDKASALYDNLDRFVKPQASSSDRFVSQFTGKRATNPAGVPVVLSNTAKMISDRMSPFEATPTIRSMAVPPKLSGILDDIRDNGGQVPWQTAKDLRSFIGQKLDSFGDDTGIPRGTWKQLYGALSDDMRNTVANQGPQALRAFDRANAFYAAGRHRIDNFIQPILRSPAAEKAVSTALSGSAQGATMLRALRRSLPTEDWGDFAGYQLRKMGLAPAGSQDASGTAFSPSTFLTNWNKLAPQAKEALFSGTQYGALRPQLDRLVRMSGAMKGVEGMANTSKTAGALGTLEAIGSAGAWMAHPALGISSLAGPWAAAKLMTSPGFVKYLTWRAGRIASRQPVNPILAGNMLRAVARSEPNVAQEIEEYAERAAAMAPRGQNSGQGARKVSGQ